MPWNICRFGRGRSLMKGTFTLVIKYILDFNSTDFTVTPNLTLYADVMGTLEVLVATGE